MTGKKREKKREKGRCVSGWRRRIRLLYVASARSVDSGSLSPAAVFCQLSSPWSTRQSLHHNQQLESHTNYPQEPGAEPRKRPQIFPPDKSPWTHAAAVNMAAQRMYANEWDGRGGCERDNVLYCNWLNDGAWRLLPSRLSRRSGP